MAGNGWQAVCSFCNRRVAVREVDTGLPVNFMGRYSVVEHLGRDEARCVGSNGEPECIIAAP